MTDTCSSESKIATAASITATIMLTRSIANDLLPTQIQDFIYSAVNSLFGRFIVFTTNHKEKLDSALLRPGRMDVHIHMSYCTPCGFKLLAATYLGVKEHPLFEDICNLITTADVTPAEVAEQLLKGGEEPNDAFRDMLQFLNLKKKENEDLKAKKIQEQELLKTKAKEQEPMNNNSSSKDGKSDN